MQNAENKSKKFVVLATYVFAVLCLIAGLFVPLFKAPAYEGNTILALKLVDVLKSMLGKSDVLVYDKVNIFGIASLSIDFRSFVIILYVIVTLLALLAFIPVALSIRKKGKFATSVYYGIEILATIVLSLFLAVTLKDEAINYNVVIALCGTVVALLVLCVLDKSKTTAVKIILFLLSAIGFLALFDFLGTVLSEKISFATAMTGEGSGVNYLTYLFARNIKDEVAGIATTSEKVVIILGTVTATLVLVNFFIDTIRLALNKERKIGQIFNITRYGIEVVAALCLLVAVLISKVGIGLMLIAVLAVAVIQLAIVIVRFVFSLLRKPAEEANVVAVEDHTEDEVHEELNNQEPVFADGYDNVDYTEEQPFAFNENSGDGDTDYAPVEEVTEQTDDDEEDDNDGYVSPEEDALAHQEALAETPADTEAEGTAEEEIDYEIKTDGTYLLPADEEVKETPVEEELDEPEEEVAEEPVEEVTEPETEVAGEAEAEPEAEEELDEPVEEVAEEPTEEPAVEEELDEPNEEVAEEEPVEEVAEPEEKPYAEEPKPFNPYERRNDNNPFRAYEQSSHPVQPYNPYQSRPVQPEKPVQPSRPVYEQKPVQSYKPYESPTDRPPLRPRPIIQEFKPVPPINEQPHTRPIYTRDRMYTGPIDDFIRKLTNEERIEFAQTFLEKSNGPLGSIPDYVIGGDNKKFFSLSFIYLGRVRGMVSDGLLNKMYKELNML